MCSWVDNGCARIRVSRRIRLDISVVEIDQASWQSGDAITVKSSEEDQRWGFKAHKVDGGLQMRWNLDKIINYMVIGQVCCGSDGKGITHEECAEGGFNENDRNTSEGKQVTASNN